MYLFPKLFSPVARDYGNLTWFIKDLDGSGFVNQYGLCRKVCLFVSLPSD